MTLCSTGCIIHIPVQIGHRTIHEWFQGIQSDKNKPSTPLTRLTHSQLELFSLLFFPSSFCQKDFFFTLSLPLSPPSPPPSG